MDILKQSALAWRKIIEYKYVLTYGYKCKLYIINLVFDAGDYPHLAGFQYMKDISIPNYTSSKVMERILDDKILFEQVEKAAQYNEMIRPRLEALIHLKNSLDNEFTLFSYRPEMYSFYTNIKADYIIASHMQIDNFIWR